MRIAVVLSLVALGCGGPDVTGLGGTANYHRYRDGTTSQDQKRVCGAACVEWTPGSRCVKFSEDMASICNAFLNQTFSESGSGS